MEVKDVRNPPNRLEAKLSHIPCGALSAMAMLSIFVGASGCRESHLPQTVPVTGRLEFNGGPMPNRGMILFVPIETAEGYIRRPGRSMFDESGQFEASSWNRGDGLVPGTYFIRIDCRQYVQTTRRPIVKSHVPKRYNQRDTSPLEEIVVKPDSGAINLGVINIKTD